MARVNVQMTGDRALAAKLALLVKTAPQAVVLGMYALGERIMADSVRRTPVDTGRLRSTAYVAPPSMVEPGVVEMGYGTQYAVAVHERTEVAHSTGEAKFLESAVLSIGPRGARTIVDVATRHILKGGQPKQGRLPFGPQEG